MIQSDEKFLIMDLNEFKLWISKQRVQRDINLIQNHHTWIPNYQHFSKSGAVKSLKGMKRSHLERGFSDIAQNFTTFPDGTIAVCRPLNTMPAGIKGANRGGICIEHVGNFDTGGDQMTEKHKKTIVALNGLLCLKFRLRPNVDSIVYHHWFDLKSGLRRNGEGNTKTCPGTNFFGGNKVSDAQSNFIPLIENYIAEIKDSVRPYTPQKETGFESKQGVVTAHKLNVRKGPGTEFNVIGSLIKNDLVTILEKKNEWFRINIENEWVASKYINLQ